MDKKREIELKPCPYCGGTDLGIGFNAVGERHYVVCSHCLMRGPEKLGDGDRAAKYWNALPRKVESLPDDQLDALEKLAGEATKAGRGSDAGAVGYIWKLPRDSWGSDL